MKRLLIILILCVGVPQAQFKLNVQSVTYETDFTSRYNSSVTSSIDNVRQSHSAHNIGLQVIVGSLSSALFFFPPALLTFHTAWNNNGSLSAAFGVLSFASFIFGNGVGVYLISNVENKKIRFWKVVEYSFIGAAAGAIIITIASTEYQTIPDEYGIAAALCPLFSSIVYTTFIADWPKASVNYPINNAVHSHKDLVNHSKVFDLELMRYEF
ncbi:MAG: hypothetical protein IPM56_08235 [Ignavibacteriales bacterium]|nr:MAG: hypothetical protein IPM56_08235 [Ignavibacteriales bacterium]